MKIFVLYFSGGGNTQLVAHHLFNRLKQMGHDVRIRFARKGISLGDVPEFDGLVVGSPVYAYSPAQTLMEVIEQSMPMVSEKPSFIFLTYGGLVGNAHIKLANALKNRGFKIVGLEEFLMADTLFLMLLFGFTKPTKWLAELPNRSIPKRLSQFPEKVVRSLRDGTEIELKYRRYSQKLTDFIAQKFHRFKPKLIENFRADERCDLCGVCVAVCPRKNIEIRNGQVIWGVDCELCLRCYTLCPRDAIQFGKWTRHVIKYKPYIP